MKSEGGSAVGLMVRLSRDLRDLGALLRLVPRVPVRRRRIVRATKYHSPGRHDSRLRTVAAAANGVAAAKGTQHPH